MVENGFDASEPTPGGMSDITPASIEALRHSEVNLDEFLQYLKRTQGKLALELYALADDYRQSGEHSPDSVASFIDGLLTMLKAGDMQRDSRPLDELFNLPPHTDEHHTPTDPLSA